MSTKTTFKRVALVAVAALGLGMLSAMPSSAAAASPTAVTVGTIPTAQVGVVNTTPVTITFPSGLASDTFSINVRVTSAPAGSQFRSLTTNLVTGVAATGNTIAAKLTITQSSTATGLLATTNGTALTDSVTVSNTYTSSTATAAAGSASFSINMTPDVAGSYTILVSTNSETSNVIASSGAGNPYTAGNANASYTVSTGATAASVVLAAVAPSTGIAGASTGMLFKATIKDAAGTAAQLGANETIGFALTSGAGTVTVVGIAPTTELTLEVHLQHMQRQAQTSQTVLVTSALLTQQLKLQLLQQLEQDFYLLQLLEHFHSSQRLK